MSPSQPLTEETPRVKPESKSQAEALIPHFIFSRVLKQDQNDRRISLLGSIHEQSALMILERAAFPSEPATISTLLRGLEDIKNLGANDVYRWYMCRTGGGTISSDASLSINSSSQPSTSSSSSIERENTKGQSENRAKTNTKAQSPPDIKLNLIYPCTPTHIRKYTSQPLRYVIETPEIYRDHIRPYIERTQRTAKRLDWIYNILEGRTEQEDVVYRSASLHRRHNQNPDRDSTVPTLESNTHRNSTGTTTATTTTTEDGFLLLPDLNWDRKTITSLHLLALVERRDLWSVRDLNVSHVEWLKRLRGEVVHAAAEVANKLSHPSSLSQSSLESNSNQHDVNERIEQAEEKGKREQEGVDGEEEIIKAKTTTTDADEFKCYIHYHPTYYHFHVHVVHVMLEAESGTQSVGKAISLDSVIGQLESMNRHATTVTPAATTTTTTTAGGSNGSDAERVETTGMHTVDISYAVGEQSDLWTKLFYRMKTGERVDLNDTG